MKAKLFIDEILIGIINLEISDESMGVLSGVLIPNKAYKNYQNEIHKHFEQKGISNIEDFNFKILLENGVQLKPEGGIGILHSREFSNEIIVETAGNNIEEIKNFC